jgi:hypothetical protein
MLVLVHMADPVNSTGLATPFQWAFKLVRTIWRTDLGGRCILNTEKQNQVVTLKNQAGIPRNGILAAYTAVSQTFRTSVGVSWSTVVFEKPHGPFPKLCVLFLINQGTSLNTRKPDRPN